MIEFKNVSKTYKTKKGVETKALNNINLKIGNKGMVFITGKSGSGKSTMLNILGGLDNITSGELLINNQNISKFKNKQYDSYRNAYIGFIFQEFNILEEYNVYENIELALRLQNQKPQKEEIENLLNRLGLKDLKQRKPNELSGGQKQRVAIARALIKNPQIILADEPTGNLDQTNGKQIFDLLKEISKEKLVIVVSHDIESANKYADRIIELTDGNITKDTNTEIEEKEEKLNLKKSKLPFSYSIKLALKSLTIKPLKLLMTCILTAMALIFMGFTVNCLIFDKVDLMTNTMKENNQYVYTVNKTEYYGLYDQRTYELKEEDIKQIEKDTKSTLNKAYMLNNNNSLLTFEFGTPEIEKPDYYMSEPAIIRFVEITDDKVVGKLIGKLPETNQELVIHKYLAEYIIKYGVIDSENNLYKPKSIEELVNSKHELKLGDNKVTISGVVDDDNSQFEEYKNGDPINNYDLRNYIQNNYMEPSGTVYVKGFTNVAKLNSDKREILTKMSITNIVDNENINPEEISAYNLNSLTENKTIITKEGLKEVNKLNKNEVILSINDLKKLDPNYNQGLEDYSKENSTLSYDEIIETYTQNYLNTNSFKALKIKLKKYNQETGKTDNIVINTIGVTIEDNSYVSNEYVEEYTPSVKTLEEVYIYDDNVKNLKEVFNKYKFSQIRDFKNGTYYTYSIPHESDISTVIGTYKALYKYILVVSLIFVLFAILLFSNFIGTSISYAKKEIGILRALGARNKDTLKIFTYESLVIGFISWILSVIGWIYACNLLNKSMFGNMYYTLNGIIKSPLVPLGMFIFTIIIALVITFISISRVNRIKPIDAILNK